MTVAAGTKLGPYVIVAPLGAGGMGEVYRARDTRLGRDVAVKVLPDSFSKDPERLHRFEQEARATSALNHPNILAIYDIGQSEESPYVVCELLEGETLGERLRSEALGKRKAIEYAVQMARGLAAAHEKGIVHRDLKPENLFITREDRVKILDFGLAKLTHPEEKSGIGTQAGTVSISTEPGKVMGTVGYMSPEQVRGEGADHRTDIFSFGTILYEMLAGQRAFQRDTTAETMTAILKEEPSELAALGKNIAPSFARVVEHCLEKRPELRFQSAKDLAFALEALSGSTSATIIPSIVHSRRPTWRGVLPWSVAAVAVIVALGTAAAYLWRESPIARRPAELRLQIVTPGDDDGMVLSPDGRQLVFSATGENGDGYLLWLRPLDSEVVKPLPGTEAASHPFWSPDSKSIGFFSNQKLRRIDLATGAVQTLADGPTPRGGSWNRDNTILFAPAGNGPLYRIPATGGRPEQVTQQRTPQEASHRYPAFLPDGHHFLFWVIGPAEVQGVYVGSLDGKEYHRLCVADGPAGFVPPNYIFLVRESVLYAQRYDLDQMKLIGEPVPVASGVSSNPTIHIRATASDTGLIAYRRDALTRSQVTWFDRSGKPAGTVGEPVACLRSGELSPDGRTLAITTQRGEEGLHDVLLMDMARGTLTRLTTGECGAGRWSPDGKRIAFSAGRSGILDLYWKMVGSTRPDEELFVSKEAKNISDWSPDGKYILFSSQSPATARDVWALPITGADRTPFPVAQTASEETNGRFSPDGKWVAYVSDETGRDEIYARPFPGPGPPFRMSTGGGDVPFWRRDGKELYYTTEGRLMAVSISGSASGALDIGMPQMLFKVRGTAVPTSDGQRFLVLTPVGEVATPPVTVIVNWASQEK